MMHTARCRLCRSKGSFFAKHNLEGWMIHHKRTAHPMLPFWSEPFQFSDYYIIREEVNMEEVKKTTIVEEAVKEPTVPVERTTTEETVSVPQHDAVREEHRVSGEPDHVVRETVVTEER
jgi:hypothetical protein